MINAMIDGLKEEEEDILVKALSQLSKFLKDKYHLNQ